MEHSLLTAIAFIISIILLLGTAWRVTAQVSQLFSEQVWIFVGVISLQLGLIVTVASWFNSLTLLGWLIVQGVVTLAAWGGVWLVQARNPLSYKQAYRWPNLREVVSEMPLIGWLGTLVILIFILLIGTIQFFTPLSYPLYGDERMYHASRVIYWLQNQSIFPYETHNDRQVVFSFGGEIFFLWSLIFLKSELVGRLIFWLAYPLSALGIYVLTRSLEVGLNKAILTTLLFVATPIVTRYATGLKPELWLTFFILGVAFWLVQSYKSSEKKQLALFWLGIFVALSINVKFTALLLIIPLGILPWYLNCNEKRWLLIGKVGLGLIIGVLFSGLVIPLAANLNNYHHILGPEAMRQVHASELSGRQLYIHGVRLPFLFFDLPEVPLVTLQEKLTGWGNTAMHALGADQLLALENKTAWPGYFTFAVSQQANKFSLGGMLWLPLLLIGGLKMVKLKAGYSPLGILILMDMVLLAGIIFLVRWMEDSGLPERFLIAPYALGLVIGITILKPVLDKIKFVQIVALLLLIYTVYPVLRTQFLRVEAALTPPLPLALLNRPFAEPLSYIPDHSTILLVGSQAVPDYPLFVPANGYSNRVISWGKSTFNSDRMRQLLNHNHITHILIENDQLVDFHWAPPLNTSEMVNWVAQQSGFSEIPLTRPQMRLFETPERRQHRLEEIKQHLQTTQFPAESPIIKVDPALHHQVGIGLEAIEFLWQPESFGQNGKVLWLGRGEQNGLRGVLWAQAQTVVNLRFEVISGPALRDQAGTVYLRGLVNGELMTVTEMFTEKSTLNFPVPLSPGPNSFTFFTLERADVFIQENGDTRPLIVGIQALTIELLP